MKKGPFFSVIIPVFNGQETIRKAIESVLNQDCQDFEIIVVDDGSTDKTSEVVRDYAGRVNYYFQENAGVSTARNLGARHAKGIWLTFLDCDDWYYPERLSLHLKMIKRHPDLDFLVGNFESRAEEGSLIATSIQSSEIGHYLLEKADGEDHVIMQGVELGGFVKKQFSDVRTLSVPRNTFLRLGGFPTQFSICEDVHFLIRLAAISNRVGVVLKPIAVYSIHDHGLVRTDPLRSQLETVKALTSLKPELNSAPSTIRLGLLESLFNARQDLATVLLRRGERANAIRAVLPLLGERPGLRSFRVVLSVAKGFLTI